MRNMKLLESFIILFEVCIAILCNLQQFSLLPDFFFFFWMTEKSSCSPSEYYNVLYCVQLLDCADDTSQWVQPHVSAAELYGVKPS